MNNRVVEFPDRNTIADEAAEWLIRLDSDEPANEALLHELAHWIARSPAHRQELENLAHLWNRLNVLTELAVPLGRHERHSNHHVHLHGFNRNSLFSRHYIAFASLVFAAISIFAVIQFGLLTDTEGTSNGLYATAVGQQKSSKLNDGSVVTLNTNSQIRVDYNERFRKIYLLQGEAHFSVAKDSGRPFRVYAGNGRIQAVGTAFSVFLDREDISITVAEGRVAIASIDDKSAASTGNRNRAPLPDKPFSQVEPDDDFFLSLGTIDAGHVATLRTTTGQHPQLANQIKDVVRQIPPEELAQRLSWREGILMFSGDTLEDVVKEVSRYTTVAIEIPDAAVREMRIGGRLRVGETGAMLAALETNFDLRVVKESRDRVLLVPANNRTSDYQ